MIGNFLCASNGLQQASQVMCLTAEPYPLVEEEDFFGRALFI
jgi:hypothetical protein